MDKRQFSLHPVTRCSCDPARVVQYAPVPLAASTKRCSQTTGLAEQSETAFSLPQS